MWVTARTRLFTHFFCPFVSGPFNIDQIGFWIIFNKDKTPTTSHATCGVIFRVLVAFLYFCSNRSVIGQNGFPVVIVRVVCVLYALHTSFYLHTASRHFAKAIQCLSRICLWNPVGLYRRQHLRLIILATERAREDATTANMFADNVLVRANLFIMGRSHRPGIVGRVQMLRNFC